MVRSAVLLASLASIGSVLAVTCSNSQKCPTDTPCCSQYGECGVGAYCLGGCDPVSSNSLDSCVPAPVCQSKTFTMKDLSGITSKTKYLGDPGTTDWVMDGSAVAVDNTVLLTMAPNTAGTVLASSTYMWYGNVKATFKTSRGAGVVTAFILLSDVKDEIDYEFVGADLQTAQTNYYFQGITNYSQGRNASLSNTFANFHTYEIRWTPDSITWLIDNQVARKVDRSGTWNATSNQWAYPQTPARVQISIWPGGAATNAKGTIDWAGGPIDWNSQDIQVNGYYYAQFQSVTIECFNANSAPGTNKGTSYTYNSVAGTNDTVVDGNKKTVLKSLLGTGTNMSADYASGSSTATSAVAVVPGLTGGGPGVDGHAGSDGQSSAAAVATIAGTGVGSSSGAVSTGFDQGTGSSGIGSSKSEGTKHGFVSEHTLRGSVFAAIVAVGVLLAL